MATNPYAPDRYEHETWEMGANAAHEHHKLYLSRPDDQIEDAWWRGYVATTRELLAAEQFGDRFLAGFDQGLEAAQEHGVAGDGRDWKEIATHLLAQVINRRIAGTWQTNHEDAVRNALAYHHGRVLDGAALAVARKHIDHFPATKDTP